MDVLECVINTIQYSNIILITGDMIIPVITENLLMIASKLLKHCHINIFKCCIIEEEMFEVC
jgi:hypothetical protein